MVQKNYKKEIALTLRYNAEFGDEGEFIGGEIENSTSHIKSETWVEIMDDPVRDRETDEWGVTGRPQIHVAGTRKAFEELGVLFLTLGNCAPPDPRHTVEVELNDREDQPAIHFVVHLPM